MRGGGEIIWCGWAAIPPNEGEAAKMAGGARRLPKWQAEQISYHKKLFFDRFFLLTFKEPTVKYRYT